MSFKKVRFANYNEIIAIFVQKFHGSRYVALFQKIYFPIFFQKFKWNVIVIYCTIIKN